VKKQTRSLIGVLMAVIIILPLFGIRTSAAVSLKLNKTSVTVTAGKTYQLKATAPKKAKVTYKSSKKSVAKVDKNKGLITAVKPGTATITATMKYNGKTYTAKCKVTVKAKKTETPAIKPDEPAETKPAPTEFVVSSLNEFQTAVSAAGTDAATITLEGVITIEGNVTVDGTDKKITVKRGEKFDDTMFSVPKGSELTMKNITVDGEIINIKPSTVIAAIGGVFNMEDGVILKNNRRSLDETEKKVGGAVVVTNGGTFNMTGGEISNCAARSGGGVYIGENCAANISGGKITGNTAVFGGGVMMMWKGACKMTGGEISGNKAVEIIVKGGNGGGVQIEDGGSFSLSGDGKISGNTALWGGGVNIVNSAFTMAGGEISGNEANGKGFGNGGGGGVSIWAGGSFTMSGGKITGNKAPWGGGGIYAQKGTINMSGGEITKNTADEGGGVSIRLESVFTMLNGEISGNTARQYEGGGVCAVGSYFKMMSGKITGNTAMRGSSGVYGCDSEISRSNVAYVWENIGGPQWTDVKT